MSAGVVHRRLHLFVFCFVDGFSGSVSLICSTGLRKGGRGEGGCCWMGWWIVE